MNFREKSLFSKNFAGKEMRGEWMLSLGRKGATLAVSYDAK